MSIRLIRTVNLMLMIFVTELLKKRPFSFKKSVVVWA